ncbi:C4-dicarboxylate transporter DcuC [Anaerosinus massiliensis]|uniref:C4-dicarboxylate transporter DcuC n=1 Tax=Massilibacillus massiliensis TaxID=1806837 RepID=UPI000ACDAFC3|nr:C4-dicarboxylate transporter DcuC [Massilibacillus massiliensis]
MNVLLAIAVIGLIGWLVIKKYKPQTVLLLGGIILMLLAYVMGYTTKFVPDKFATGFFFFDMFEHINQLATKDVAGLGLMIMSVTGFAKYMDHIGASSSLVYLAMKPLGRLNAPYLVMSLSFLLCMFMALFIPSASGLAMLMMVTVFPILVKVGISRIAAASIVSTGHLLDIGPASATSLLIAKTSDISVNQYFADYQIPVYITTGICAALAHYFWQKYLDRKESEKYSGDQNFEAVISENQMKGMAPPGPVYYVILPLLPLVFLLGFSEYAIATIKMNVVLAMFLSLFISMLCEFIRLWDFKKVCASIQIFFKGMGEQFTMTVTLIIAGETFAYGLQSIGVVDAVVKGSQGMGISASFITLGIVSIITMFSVIMGSGVAPMFAFTPLIPNIAKGLGENPAVMLLPMQNASSLGRIISPISAVMIAVAGIANVSTVELVKRNSVPVILSLLVSTICTFIFN